MFIDCAHFVFMVNVLIEKSKNIKICTDVKRPKGDLTVFPFHNSTMIFFSFFSISE